MLRACFLKNKYCFDDVKKRGLLGQDYCGGSYCSKNLDIEVRDKKELNISPDHLSRDLKIHHQDKSDTKKSLSISSRDFLVSHCIQDQSDKTLFVSGKKRLDILKVVTVDYWGPLWCQLHSRKNLRFRIFIGPPSTRMPMLLSPFIVTFVNVKERLERDVMPQNAIQSLRKNL
ncbi:hypothetical protein Tco_0491872 [Tanacetum coccineum]